ncbi:nucleotide pyrophosphohydrolase [bacterium]|nr:nucleotide pyrophosphohydrolase [bacterium]
MSEIKELTKLINKFYDDRDWHQFHNHKDIALSLVLEVAEVLEHFQWKTREEAIKYAKTNKEEIGEEIADVAVYLLTLSDAIGLDLKQAIEKKMVKNAQKYPIEKSKGNNKKYTQL